jgi:hypothetical protein
MCPTAFSLGSNADANKAGADIVFVVVVLLLLFFNRYYRFERKKERMNE